MAGYKPVQPNCLPVPAAALALSSWISFITGAKIEPKQPGPGSVCHVESCGHQPRFSLTHPSQRAGVRVKTGMAINILRNRAGISWQSQGLLCWFVLWGLGCFCSSLLSVFS